MGILSRLCGKGRRGASAKKRSDAADAVEAASDWATPNPLHSKRGANANGNRRRRVTSDANGAEATETPGAAAAATGGLKLKLQIAATVLLFLFYSPVVRATLSVFHLYPHPVRQEIGDEKHFLQADLSVEAGSPAHGVSHQRLQ